jgi:hypothetical protein
MESKQKYKPEMIINLFSVFDPSTIILNLSIN